jgi:hypothetical protein
MPLSRLDNFLKNVRGNVLYVDPNGLDATDSVENTGNSASRPFLSIQRALIEAARFSYQVGIENDRFAQTTIVLTPAEYTVDNRPGWIPDGSSNFILRSGATSSNFPEISSTSNFDLEDDNNILYKLNSIYGGIIVPRGTSIVSEDPRKTKIRPKYVPDPFDSNIENSAIFRLTGGSYVEGVTILDGDPYGTVYKNYTVDIFVPNYSHHKLTAFEFADGVNSTDIDDSFLTFYTSRNDLELYYEKVGLLYGSSSGREISPDYPNSGVDIQSKVEEYRIVSPISGRAGISTITASGTTVTITLTDEIPGINVDSGVVVSGVSDSVYNGTFTVNSVVIANSDGTLSFQYDTPTAPTDTSPSTAGTAVELLINSVVGSSPYIAQSTTKSSYGMSAVKADGSKVSGFKSILLNEFNGIGLQNDENAFVRYNSTTGSFDDSSSVSNLSTDPDAVYKPAYYNNFIKVTNGAFAQVVSSFGIGYSQQFVTESGGNYTVSNSNSNFGQNSLYSVGFRDTSYTRDDVGYISHIVPPEFNVAADINIEYDAIDVSKTVGVGSTSRLYLYQQTTENSEPKTQVQGYRIGAKQNGRLGVNINDTNYYARVIMPNTEKDTNQVSSVKVVEVGTNVSTGNSISANTITLKENHQFINGETIRVLSDNARLPDGLDSNTVYFAITDGLSADQVQVAISLNDAINGNELVINNLGGNLRVESRVSDKRAGDIGHPVQWDSTEGQWFIQVGTGATDNTIYPTLTALGTAGLGDATPRTYITRKPDTRGLQDRIYRARYVIPAGSGISSSRAPQKDYVLQQSSDVTGANDAEVALQFSPTSVSMSNETEMRNFSFIRKADWSANVADYTTELPHRLSVGSKVKVVNVTSTNNTTAIGNSGFNGTFTVTGISSANQFTVTNNNSDPGAFTNNTSSRTNSLPTYQRVEASNNFYVYDVQNIVPYVTGIQDGVYYLTIVDSSNTPVIAPFNDSDRFSFSSPIKDLYPQEDRDNPLNDPTPAITYADASILGAVVIDEPRNSVTKQAIDRAYVDFGIGVGITDIVSTAAGTAHTLFTSYDHGLNRITSVSITSAGAGYGNGTGSAENLYNATLTNSNTGINATARITVNSSGAVTGVKIMNGGTNYVVGDVLNVTGTATTTGFSTATVTVSTINDNTGDTIRVAGVTSEGYADYNQLYRITGISTTKEIEVASVSPVYTNSIDGVGSDVLTNAYEQITGVGIDVSSFVVNTSVGLATVTTVQPHGLRVDSAITLGGASDDLYNGTFIVTQNVGLTTFVVNIGVSTLSPAVSGTQRVFYPGLTAQDGTINFVNENFGGRFHNVYAGITTVLSAEVASASVTEISIENVGNFDLNIGDYLRIDDEIMRIKSTVSGNPVEVFRGLFGTVSTTHVIGSVIRRINVNAVELRQPSGVTANGHTFEYPGYGAGNYSTALPELQDRKISDQRERLAQNLESAGGSNQFAGYNANGDYFIGNRKIDRSTGRSISVDTPIPTITGEDVFALSSEVNVDLIQTDEIRVKTSLKVAGGLYNDSTTEFDGPVVFSQKLTSTSSDGIEASSIYLQGDRTVARNYTVGIATPTTAGNPGDVVYNGNPVSGGILGWVFTTENSWFPFGSVGIDTGTTNVVFDKVGVATDDPGDASFKVGSGSTQFTVDSDGVGIGTTANGEKVRIEGYVVATGFTGDGSGLTNLQNDSAWAGVSTIYPIGNKSVGIGTTFPSTDFKLSVGTPGEGGTDLFVANDSRFDGVVTLNAGANVTGMVTVTSYNLDSSSGTINVGFITATSLDVGTSGTFFTADSTGVGVGTATPRAKLDVEGATRFKTYYEIAKPVTTSSGAVTLDLSQAQTFILTTSEAVNFFTLTNVPTSSTTAFTLQVIQDSTGYTVDADDFRTVGGSTIPIKWPGGIAPVVTSTASAVDIYSFMTFDGGSTLYGVIGGQNFS